MCFIVQLLSTPHPTPSKTHMCPLSCKDTFTFLGHLCLTHFSKDGKVMLLYGMHMCTEAQSMSERIAAYQFLEILSHFLHFLFDTVTDENSESESDTEEKLKGEQRTLCSMTCQRPILMCFTLRCLLDPLHVCCY